jgi:hypothetical protein
VDRSARSIGARPVDSFHFDFPEACAQHFCVHALNTRVFRLPACAMDARLSRGTGWDSKERAGTNNQEI